MNISPIHARISRYAPGLKIPAHTDGVLRISVVIAGAVSERCGRREEFARAGSLVIKPADARHQNQFGPLGAQMLSIALPESAERALLPEGAGHWRWLHTAPLARLATRLWLRASQLNLRNSCSADAGANQHELFDPLMDLLAAAQSDASCAVRSKKARPSWLTRLQNELDACFVNPPSVAMLAAQAGVHPVYLARQFRRYFRCTISEYIHARRMVMIVQHMARPSANLAAIAQDAGYADQSHFNRVWRRELGLTPRACRRLLSP